MRRMAELHAGVPEIVIPRVVEEASTARILTTEYEEGLSPDEACSNATPQELKDRWGVVLFDFLLRGILENRLLHADPNLANFAFRRDGRVVVYDFGCVKEVPVRLSRGYRALCRAVLEGGVEEMPALLMKMGMHRADGQVISKELIAPFLELVLELVRPAPPYRFGADGSGFPEGTQTRFVLSVAINGTNASAVYHIGRIEGMPAEQYGLMALAVRR